MTFGVLGLHCAVEGRALEQALGRCQGITGVHLNQTQATVSFHAASESAVVRAQTAAQHAGVRLVDVETLRRRVLDVDRRTWISGGLAVAGFLVGLAAQVAESGQWLALIADVDHDHPQLVSGPAYLMAIAAAAVTLLPNAWRSLTQARLDMHVLVVVAVIGAVWLGEVAEGAAVATLFVVAVWLEAWSAARARHSVAGLMQQETSCRCSHGDEPHTPASTPSGHWRTNGVPTGIRTPVLALKGPRPRPLDDGDSGGET